MSKFILYQNKKIYVYDATINKDDRAKFLKYLKDNYSYQDTKIRENVHIHNEMAVIPKNSKYEVINQKLIIEKEKKKNSRIGDVEETILIYPQIYNITKHGDMNYIIKRLDEWKNTKEPIEKKYKDKNFKIDKDHLISCYYNMINFKLVDIVDESTYLNEIKDINEKLKTLTPNQTKTRNNLKNKLYKLSNNIKIAKETFDILSKYNGHLNFDTTEYKEEDKKII